MKESVTSLTSTQRQTVSVCLASYNGEHYIEEQIQSVLAQLAPSDELIVSDDASSDQTVDIIKRMGDTRIRLLQNAKSLGIVQNFARALKAAQNEVIFLCDQDDVWLPNKVDRMLVALTNGIMVVSDCQVVDAQLAPLHASFFALRGSRPGIAQNLWRNAYLGCCIAFKRTLLSRALPVPSKVPMHDMWLGLVAQTMGTVVFLPEVLSLYRRHGNAASDGARVSRSSRWQQLAWRWRLASALMLRWGLGR